MFDLKTINTVVRELEEERRIVLAWDDDGQTVIELAEVEDGTLVHVVETAPGFATALELSALACTPVA